MNIHGSWISMDIHLCISNKWIIRHEYRLDGSTRLAKLFVCVSDIAIGPEHESDQ